MLNSILSIIKKYTIDKGPVWTLFITVAIVTIDGIIDIMFCKPSIPLMVMVSVIGLILSVYRVICILAKSDEED